MGGEPGHRPVLLRVQRRDPGQRLFHRLTEIGDWLRINGDAIYGSGYWIQATDGNVRFTVTPGRFNMISLGWPGNELVVSAPVPISADSKVRLLGGDGTPLPWTQQNGNLVVTMPAAGPSATSSNYAYTFTFDWRR
jgi:alpha-L-fucosidase